MEKVIKIDKKLLAFRDQAQALAKTAQEADSPILTLDFKKVEFISRNFMDEFLNIKEALAARSKNIKIKALKPELRQFMTQVQKSKTRIKAQMALALKG